MLSTNPAEPANARRYRFDDDALQVTVLCTAYGAIDLSRLIENIPLSLGEDKPYGVVANARGQTDLAAGSVTTDGIEVTDGKGNGVDIVFDQPRRIYINRKGMGDGDKARYGRVEIELPVPSRKRTIRFAYRFVPKTD